MKAANKNEKLHISDIEERLCLGNFTINKPQEWDLENVRLKIQDYHYDSTTINIDQLRMLHNYIGEILNVL